MIFTHFGGEKMAYTSKFFWFSLIAILIIVLSFLATTMGKII
ncbi:hypothetical protein TorRG33x02_155680 [Trema orientale]|uniref:Uncharacterized protein n=1 Tax=Trema orientale TaxID=63057 RepID=A0A2P5ET13_TREOI|nr:hypothetical protein TorRG33x02_155680 [Trema orientale]